MNTKRIVKRTIFFITSLFFYSDCLFNITGSVTQVPILGIIGLLFAITILINYLRSPSFVLVAFSMWTIITLATINKFAELNSNIYPFIFILFIPIFIGMFFLQRE